VVAVSFSIFIHENMSIFPPYAHSYPLPYILLLATDTNTPDRTYFAFLLSVFEKEKNDIFVYLR
jgi:hypothetical protein